MKKIKVNIEKSEYGYSAYMSEGIESLGYSIVGEGKTVTETMADFRDSYNEIKEYSLSHGEPFIEAEFVYYYDTVSFIQYFAGIFSLAGLERITGINQKQLGHYLSGFRKPSARTASRMEESVKKFSQELASIHFS